MTIGIHGVALTKEYETGVEHYTRMLLKHLFSLSKARTHHFLLYTNDAGKPLPKRFTGIYPHVSKRELTAPFLWTQVRLSAEFLFRKRPDTLFVPAQALPRILPDRTVVTVHGVEFDQRPETYATAHRMYLRAVTKDALRRASAVVVPSQATKKELVTRYRADPQKIHVVHHGAPMMPDIAQAPDALPSFPYFLVVGRVEAHKNIQGILSAFEKLHTADPEFPHHLIFIGAPGFGFERMQKRLVRSPVNERVHFLGFVSEEKKWRLLAETSALLFPSFAEGFGLPILEAQAAGAPVITADAGAMPEVAGEGALLVDPESSEALADAMRRIVEDAAFRKSLVARGEENVQRFSWERCAKETLAVLLGEA